MEDVGNGLSGSTPSVCVSILLEVSMSNDWTPQTPIYLMFLRYLALMIVKSIANRAQNFVAYAY
jgi:hypothetical protein